MEKKYKCITCNFLTASSVLCFNKTFWRRFLKNMSPIKEAFFITEEFVDYKIELKMMRGKIKLSLLKYWRGGGIVIMTDLKSSFYFNREFL